MSNTLKAYTEYKESGIELLDQIPHHWKSIRLRFVCKMNPSKQEVNSCPSEFEVTFLPMEKVSEDGQIDNELTKKINEVVSGYTYFRDGDILLAKITPCFENGKGAIVRALINGIGFGSTEFHVLRAGNDVTTDFLYNVTKSHLFRKTGEAFMKGAAGQKRVPEDFIRDFRIGIPEIHEQKQICCFINHESHEIENILTKYQNLIELLKEKRVALINHAVTKGLDPSVKMKDSGVEWIGKIPQHWDIWRLKYIAKIKYGLGQPPQEMIGGLPLIRATNVERGKITEKDMVFVDPEDVPYERDPILKTNDIIVVRSGAYTADSAIIPQEYDGAISGYDMVVRVNNANPIFVSFALLTPYVVKAQLYLQKLRAAQPHINAEELGETLILLPQEEKEQKSIVEYINSETSKTDQLIEKISKQIELLSEYKTSLISHAVTGKIDVRGVV